MCIRDRVNIQPVLDVFEKGYIPVISTLGCDDEGNVYNINADTAAERIAGGLEAESLIIMTDISGILWDKDDPNTLIRQIYADDTEELEKEGVISGGMIPKVKCCTDAIKNGDVYKRQPVSEICDCQIANDGGEFDEQNHSLARLTDSQ